MDPKPRPNNDRYIEILRRMTPSQRLEKALELSEISRQLFVAGFRTRHPELSESEVSQRAARTYAECHKEREESRVARRVLSARRAAGV